MNPNDLRLTLRRDLYFLPFVVSIISIFLIDYTQSVPIDYCLTPLNTSSCGGRATPVFYYYKPGSRCEIGIWRGCPTKNKFPDEYLCAYTCIARLRLGASEENNIITLNGEANIAKELKEWEIELNKIPNDDAEELVQIIDDIAEEIDNSERMKLKLILGKNKTTVNYDEAIEDVIDSTTNETEVESDDEPESAVNDETTIIIESNSSNPSTDTPKPTVLTTEMEESGEASEVITT